MSKQLLKVPPKPDIIKLLTPEGSPYEVVYLHYNKPIYPYIDYFRNNKADSQWQLLGLATFNGHLIYEIVEDYVPPESKTRSIAIVDEDADEDENGFFNTPDIVQPKTDRMPFIRVESAVGFEFVGYARSRTVYAREKLILQHAAKLYQGLKDLSTKKEQNAYQNS